MGKEKEEINPFCVQLSLKPKSNLKNMYFLDKREGIVMKKRDIFLAMLFVIAFSLISIAADQKPKKPAKSDCSSNKYNCSDFKTWEEAQATFHPLKRRCCITRNETTFMCG